MKIECPFCNSANIYYSKKRQKYVCEDCEREFIVNQTIIPQKIFMSYGHDKNEYIVLLIKDALEKRGHIVWMDKSAIHAGDDWRKQITFGLMDSSSVLSFLSCHSVRNPGVCLDELKIAICVKSGYIKTIMLEPESDIQVPSTVSHIQWLDMSNWRDKYDEGGSIWESWITEKLEDIYRIVESSEAITFSGDIQKLKDILNPNLLDAKEQALLNEQYVGREWLEKIVDDWIQDKNSVNAFVLIAGPGLGKSCFAAHLLHYHPNVVCGLFCEWDKPVTVNAKNVVMTIAFKLACKLPDYRLLLLKILTGNNLLDNMRQKTAEGLFDFLLTEPLNSLIDGNRCPCAIVIDGLDESIGSEGEALLNLLALNLKRLPKWIKFILTSRPERNIESIFAEYNPCVLHPDSALNREDIRNYIAVNLQSCFSGYDKLSLLNTITDNCQGSFLYASLVVKSVLNGTFNIEDIGSFPPGLNSFYYYNFYRKYPDEQSFVWMRDFLELIVASKRLPAELCEDFGIDKYKYRKYIYELGALINESDVHMSDTVKIKCISFVHKSIADWLTDANRSGQFYIDIQNGCKKLCSKVCERLHIANPKMLADEPLTVENSLNKYFERNITYYFEYAGDLKGLESFLLSKDVPFIPYWKRIYYLFPSEWNMNDMIARLKNDDSSLTFFKSLQKAGEIKQILWLFELMRDNYDIASLNVELFKIYTDMVHLSGDYVGAVNLDKDYLAAYSIDEIVKNRDLLDIESRMLHHSKFFTAADKLIPQVDLFLSKINVEINTQAYLEFLIMGGNLGTLVGDIPNAEKYCEIALNISKKYGSKNFELRAVRKKVDILKYKQCFDDAFSLIFQYVNDNTEPESRYEVYLICSLGELYRATRNFDKAYDLYKKVEAITKERGIKGWLAHSYLALGCLMSEFGHLTDADAFFKKALKIYASIQQDWGIISTNVCILNNQIIKGEEVNSGLYKTTCANVNRLQYNFYKPYLCAIKAKEITKYMPLMFI